MRYFILGFLAALAVVAPVAQAEPVKTSPLVAVTYAEKGAKNVKFGFDVMLSPIPAKCSGTLTVSRKISKKKTVRWTGKLSVKYGNCGTTIRGKLPKSNYGKTRKFKFKFPGSKSIREFSYNLSIKLAPPKPIALPPVIGAPGSLGPQHPGSWIMFKKDDNTDSGWSFTLRPDYTVPGLVRPSSDVTFSGGDS